MRIKLEILELRSNSDGVFVTCQGYPRKGATWRDMPTWKFSVPEFVGRHYRIGQMLPVKVGK